MGGPIVVVVVAAYTVLLAQLAGQRSQTAVAGHQTMLEVQPGQGNHHLVGPSPETCQTHPLLLVGLQIHQLLVAAYLATPGKESLLGTDSIAAGSSLGQHLVGHSEYQMDSLHLLQKIGSAELVGPVVAVEHAGAVDLP